jgi:hypothetical protein
MHKLAPACVLLLFATTLLGQTKAEQVAKKPATKKPAVTRIGKHRLGEPFNDWLVIEKIDLSRPSTYPTTTAGVSPQEILAHIGETGDGGFSLGTGYGSFTWTFVGGKLDSADTIFEVGETAHQMAFLRETYGPPSNISQVPVQNGFGARWSDTVAIWNMPDGTIIRLHVDRGPDPCVFVRFEQKQVKAQPSNPYKAPE